MQAEEKVLIVLNGGRIPPTELPLWLACATHVIAADGGANALADAGLEPHTVLGDFDSVRPDLHTFFNNATFLPDPDQHSTDFQKAIRHAVVELNAKEIAVIGAEGDRVDHLLSTFGAAAKYAAEANIRFFLDTMICHIVATDASFQTKPGATVSLIPLPAAAVTATNLEFPVEALALVFGHSDGVSNRATSDRIELTVHKGTLAVFIEREPGAVAW
jgi:thiamine pyrophosphokinase